MKKVIKGAERGEGEFAGEGALLRGGVALNDESSTEKGRSNICTTLFLRCL